MDELNPFDIYIPLGWNGCGHDVECATKGFSNIEQLMFQDWFIEQSLSLQDLATKYDMSIDNTRQSILKIKSRLAKNFKSCYNNQDGYQ